MSQMGTTHSVLKTVIISQKLLSKLLEYSVLIKLLLAAPFKRATCKRSRSSTGAENGDDPSQPGHGGVVERQNLFLFTDDAWAPGSELTVSLIAPVPRNRNFDVRGLIERCAAEWTKGVDLYFLFLNEADPRRTEANVRIGFHKGFTDSVVGRLGARALGPEQPTMNLEITERQKEAEARCIILHEFGHALGFRHEHTSPNFPFQFNKKFVINDMARRLRKGIAEATTYYDTNFETDTEGKEVQASKFDAASIMMYQLSADWHTGRIYLPQSSGLSDTDRTFIIQVYGRDPGTKSQKR